jgi:hypothetical protein
MIKNQIMDSIGGPWLSCLILAMLSLHAFNANGGDSAIG